MTTSHFLVVSCNTKFETMNFLYCYIKIQCTILHFKSIWFCNIMNWLFGKFAGLPNNDTFHFKIGKSCTLVSLLVSPDNYWETVNTISPKILIFVWKHRFCHEQEHCCFLQRRSLTSLMRKCLPNTQVVLSSKIIFPEKSAKNTYFSSQFNPTSAFLWASQATPVRSRTPSFFPLNIKRHVLRVKLQ